MTTRIAVCTRTHDFWGGSYQYAKALTAALGALDRNRFEIHVWHEEDDDWQGICSAGNFTGHVLDTYAIPPEMLPIAQKIYRQLERLPENEVSARKALLAPLQQFSADAMIERYRPDIMINPQMGRPRYCEGARHVGVVHDLMHRYESRFPEAGSPLEIRAREHLFREMVAKCDTLLVDSTIGASHVLESYRMAREEQLDILPFAAFSEVLEAEPQLPDFDLPEKFFFYPAQFWLHKNHAGLARAIGRLKKDCPEITVVTAGNTRQNGFPAFQDEIEKYDLSANFIVPGYQPAGVLNWLYRHARALVMPTFFGPTNIPPLEAMSLGCPLAISGIYGMPEQCGDAALYFDPADDGQIAEVLARLWRDDALCQELQAKGMARGRIYDVDKFNARVINIVERLATRE